VRRVLAILAIMTGLLALAISFGAGARAATLPDCLASKHVCVSSDARSLVSQDRQSQLERQIGGGDIYLVVAPAGASGYDSSMRQLISDLGAKHDHFVVGFLDTGRLHFGAYNRGVLAAGGAASIATSVVAQHKGDQDIVGALQDFVREVKQQSGSSGSQVVPHEAPAGHPAGAASAVSVVYSDGASSSKSSPPASNCCSAK